MAMQFRKAERKKAKARIGLCGPAGSGKTYSGLLLAFGLVGPEGKVAVICTEHGSAELYSHLGNYDVLVMEPPFKVENYLEAIRLAERQGYEALLIDSLSHAWAGPGGLLEFVDKMVDVKNKFTAWREATPLHNELVEAMLQSKMHVIATMRSKMEYIVTTDEKGRQVPKKVGLAPVQRDGLEYEFTLVFDIDQQRNIATTSKDRTSMFKGFCDIITRETGEKIRDWLESGADGTQYITAEQAAEIKQIASEIGVDTEAFLKATGAETFETILPEKYQWAMSALSAKKAQLQKAAEKAAA